MRIGAILQARMTSTRLPGKVLTTVLGKPLLGYGLERLQRCRDLDTITVATSNDPADDGIADFCRQTRVPCFRGPLDHVAMRLLEAALEAELDALVRVCADSPLLDPGLLERAVKLFRTDAFDLVTNVMPRGFPPGQSVEVIRVTTLTRTLPRLVTPEDREHVTRYFYRHRQGFCIYNIAPDRDYGDLRLVVDTPEDLEQFAAIVAAMSRPQWTYGLDELVQLGIPLTR